MKPFSLESVTRLPGQLKLEGNQVDVVVLEDSAVRKQRSLSMPTRTKMRRREFLKGAFAGAASFGTLNYLAACTKKSTQKHPTAFMVSLS